MLPYKSTSSPLIYLMGEIYFLFAKVGMIQ